MHGIKVSLMQVVAVLYLYMLILVYKWLDANSVGQDTMRKMYTNQ